MKKGVLAVILFNVFYIISFLFFYGTRGNYEFLSYVGVIILFAILIGTTLNITKFDYFVLWGLSIWGLLHMLGGSLIINGSTLYSLRLFEILDYGGQFYILKMDQVIHFYGFFVAALVVFQLIAPHFKDLENKRKRVIFLSWIGSMGLGALNEVVEFLAFITIEKTGVGDLYNTGLDLIFNMLGAFFGAFVAYYLWKIKNSR